MIRLLVFVFHRKPIKICMCIHIMKITDEQAFKLGEHFKINFDDVDFDEWVYGLNVELEHGKQLGAMTNLTNDNKKRTAKIAIAHLSEFPDYYKRLKKLEESASKFWAHKKKDIFVDFLPNGYIILHDNRFMFS